MKRPLIYGLLLLLLAFYPVSYIALLEPQVSIVIGLQNKQCTRHAAFRGAGTSDFIMAFYKPLIALDQSIRPDYWSWTE